jgi:ribosomal-protein-alanine N-acetyltransferase
MILPTLETPRLLLRKFEPSDAKKIQFLLKNKNVVKTTATIPHPYPSGLAKKWISNLDKNIKKKSEFTWAITLLGNDELIGAISLWNFEKRMEEIKTENLNTLRFAKWEHLFYPSCFVYLLLRNQAVRPKQ